MATAPGPCDSQHARRRALMQSLTRRSRARILRIALGTGRCSYILDRHDALRWMSGSRYVAGLDACASEVKLF